MATTSNRSSVRLLAAVAVSLLTAACASGPAASVEGVPGFESSAPTGTPLGSVPVPASPSPVSAEPTAAAAEPTPFELPTPACPAPPDAVVPPIVTASAAGGTPIPMTLGSTVFTTCSTVASDDRPQPPLPDVAIAAHPGEFLRLALPAGWRFLRWSGNDDVRLDSGTVFLPTDTPGRPQSIDLPVPPRPGDHLGFYHLWIVSSDGRVVGDLETFVRVVVVD